MLDLQCHRTQNDPRLLNAILDEGRHTAQQDVALAISERA